MNPGLLVPIIETAQAAARTLISALDVLKHQLQPPVPQECQHPRRQDISTLGNRSFYCPDCGHKEETKLEP